MKAAAQVRAPTETTAEIPTRDPLLDVAFARSGESTACGRKTVRPLLICGAVATITASFAAGFYARPIIAPPAPTASATVSAAGALPKKDDPAARAALNALRDFRALLAAPVSHWTNIRSGSPTRRSP
jgi:hypothetical protein